MDHRVRNRLTAINIIPMQYPCGRLPWSCRIRGTPWPKDSRARKAHNFGNFKRRLDIRASVASQARIGVRC
jgi:hypothetical protein